MEKLDRVKGEQSRLKAMLEDKTAALMNMRAEANKLRPYTEQSPVVLEQSLRGLTSSLNADRVEIERLDNSREDVDYAASQQGRWLWSRCWVGVLVRVCSTQYREDFVGNGWLIPPLQLRNDAHDIRPETLQQ